MRWPFARKRRLTLICMRLEDMHRMHPDMDTRHRCSECLRLLGIYPSGMAGMRRFGERNTDLFCSVCKVPNLTGLPAADILAEVLDSRPRR